MVKATFVLSALFAFTAAVSAAPLLDRVIDGILYSEDPLINVAADDTIGVTDFTMQDNINGLGHIEDPRVEDNLNGLRAL